MRFIKITERGGKEVFLNIDCIMSFASHGGTESILRRTDGCVIHVTEPLYCIIDRIKEAEGNHGQT